MKVLILNSGTGSRMGEVTSKQPKCMTEISWGNTILSRQLEIIADAGISQVVITTGPFDSVLINYCQSLKLPLQYTFIKNEAYKETNYIYSVYCAREYLDDDIILIHGDLVFDHTVFYAALNSDKSCMVVSSTLPMPEKDFKAVIQKNRIRKIGTEFFNEAVAAQPLYKINKSDWILWLNRIVAFCEAGNTKCYAEDALNEILEQCMIYPLDIKNQFCNEIDNQEDLAVVSSRVAEIDKRTVYMCFSTDMIHSGHIKIIKNAARLGKVIIGVLSDEAVMSYKRFPLLPFSERKALFQSIKWVYEVVDQQTLSYKENLLKYQPTYVVHGDDWITGFQRPVRDEVAAVLASYGGTLVEFPYSNDEKYISLENRARADLSLPDVRRSRLKKVMEVKGTITAIETHSGITGLIAEKTVVYQDGKAHQFDAMWVSSLCDSTSKGKPDIELVDMTSRFRTIDDIMEVTTKPVIFDGDTGGPAEHFVYTVKSLERMGVSMVIIEDKTGLKKNSLFGNDVKQTQETIENFCAKISAGKRAQKTKDFMIVARIESLILERGMNDALTRAAAYRNAGADGIMIHSRKKDPDEIFEFIEKFRSVDYSTPVVVVPTTFNSVTEEEFKARGVNVIIYANQLTRTGFPAMQKAARTILECHRAKECDETCMPIKDIINLIPEEI
ncbi:phosphoenolpyruvate mutase [Hungatella hathewayi]|uniref:phosphoenolpyruvate mutase n=1 Tax=Hungatella hathewayi TaxID=154046 RepID=UPI00356759F9